VMNRLHLITAAAARSGVVIYSIDARGLIGDNNDLSNHAAVDPSGRLQRASGGEIAASQDGLNALARDTGGRALFNTNTLSTSVTTALKETSVYYLVAWRPENEEQRNGKYKRIDVNIIGRPDVAVRLRRDLAHPEAVQTANRATNKKPVTPKTPIDDLREALRATYPNNAFPMSLALEFVNLDNAGTVLTASMKIEADAEAFSVIDGKQSALIDIAGLVFDDHGKPAASFQEHLTISANSDVQLKPGDSYIYNYRVPLAPGLYQVRVAARDRKSGRTGSAMRWVEMPDLAAHHLALSSIIAGERIATNDSERAAAGSDNSEKDKPSDPFSPVRPNVEHRFAKTSLLRFLVFTYNAMKGALPGAPIAGSPEGKQSGLPDVAVQVQVMRDNEPVITTTLHKIDTQGVADLQRLPYAAEIPLKDLPAGRYLLKVTVIDRIAKTSATQQFDFAVD